MLIALGRGFLTSVAFPFYYWRFCAKLSVLGEKPPGGLTVVTERTRQKDAPGSSGCAVWFSSSSCQDFI